MTAATWPDLTYNYSGAAVLVTGGTSGIGAGIAEAYRAANAEVTITGTRGSAQDYDSDLRGYRYLQLDVEDDASINKVVAAVPKVDILINNAGLALASLGLDEYEPEIFERSIRMHLTGVYRMARGCVDKLAQSRLAGGGSIIGIASMTSYFAVDVVPGYGAAKGALVQLTKTLAVHYAKRNIRVNSVAAGLTASRMTQHTLTNPQYTEPTLARTPLGRLGQPIDIAGPVLFLTSAAAAFVTGQTLPVDGGFSVVG